MTARREVVRYRRDAEKAFSISGNKFFLRRAYNFLDFEDGLTEHCPVCWDDGYDNPTDKECPTCYGRGFYPAYHDVETFWGYVQVDFDSEIDKSESGQDHVYRNDLKMSYPPMFQTDDLVAEVMSFSPRAVSAVYFADGEVTRSGISGRLSLFSIDDGTNRFDDVCVGQEAKLKLLYPDDLRAQQEFWQ